MRTILKAVLAWSEIGIPVGLASTTQKMGATGFRTIHQTCGQPVNRGVVCPDHGLVPDDELVKGVEIAPGQFVHCDQDELDAIAPQSSRQIRILSLLDNMKLHPLLLDRAYHLVPAEHRASKRPYALLQRTLTDMNQVAIARFVGWGSEYVAAIRPFGERGLMLRTLHDPAVLVDAREIDRELRDLDLSEDELRLARALALRQNKTLGRTDLSDHYRARLAELVDAKIAGRQVVVADRGEQPEPIPALDLADALERSLRKTRGRRAAA